MSWADLETTVEHIKTREAEFFGTTADATVIAQKKDLAKDVMRRDLADALGYDIDDDASMDVIAVDYATDLQRALAYLQLHLIFTDQDTGEGSVNRHKAEHYGSLYAKESQRFRTFADDVASASVQEVPRWL